MGRLDTDLEFPGERPPQDPNRLDGDRKSFCFEAMSGGLGGAGGGASVRVPVVSRDRKQ